MALGLVGSVFLHPDFGVAKTNRVSTPFWYSCTVATPDESSPASHSSSTAQQLIRRVHKWASRATLMLAWVTAIGGLLQLSKEPLVLALYFLPLMAFVPISLT